MLRKLKIAVSVFFALLCVLTLVLWIRSHWFLDSAYFPLSASVVGFQSMPGKVFAIRYWEALASEKKWIVYSLRLTNDVVSRQRPFSGAAKNGAFNFMIPHWFIAQSFALVALAPWISWKKFTVKRLLVLTTYLAVLCTFILLSRR